MSEPADQAATSLPLHEHCSRAFSAKDTVSDTGSCPWSSSRPVLSSPGLGPFPRFAELASIGLWPKRAFTIGALVAAPLGHAPSAIVHSGHRARI